MNKLLMLTTAVLLGSAGLVAAQTSDATTTDTTTTATSTDTNVSGLATQSAFSLPKAQANNGVLELGTVTVAADCGTNGTVCTVEVYEVTDEAMATNLAEDNVLNGGANNDVKITLRTNPTSDVYAVLKVNGVEQDRIEIDLDRGDSSGNGDNGGGGDNNDSGSNDSENSN